MTRGRGCSNESGRGGGSVGESGREEWRQGPRFRQAPETLRGRQYHRPRKFHGPDGGRQRSLSLNEPAWPPSKCARRELTSVYLDIRSRDTSARERIHLRSRCPRPQPLHASSHEDEEGTRTRKHTRENYAMENSISGRRGVGVVLGAVVVRGPRAFPVRRDGGGVEGDAIGALVHLVKLLEVVMVHAAVFFVFGTGHESSSGANNECILFSPFQGVPSHNQCLQASASGSGGRPRDQRGGPPGTRHQDTVDLHRQRNRVSERRSQRPSDAPR